MRSSVALFVGLAVVVFGASAAGAQFPVYNDRNAAKVPYEAEENQELARKVMHDYALCVVKRSRPEVMTYLQSYPNSKNAWGLARKLSTRRCLIAANLSFNEVLFRSAVYNILYRAEFGESRPSLSFEGVSVIDYAPPPAVETFDDARAPMLLRQFADCVVRASPQGAHALILSDVATPAEDNAFEHLKPKLAPCMIKDVTVRFSRALLRGIIAEVAYRLSRKMETGESK